MGSAKSTARILSFVLAVCLLGALFTACSSLRRPELHTQQSTRKVTDDSGREIELPEKIDRVVSLAPNLTEIIFAVGAGPTLVGDTDYCDFPEAAKKITKVGDTLHPNLERLVALHPQLVLVSTASQLETFTQQLAAQNIPAFVTDPHDLEGVFRSIEQVGNMLGHSAEATALLNQLRGRTAKVETATKQLPKVRVFYQLSEKPLYTAGRDAFVTDLMRRAGAISVTEDVPGAWPMYSAESARASQPDAIVLPTGGSMGNANSVVAEPLRSSQAFINGRVYKINDDHLARPGPRSVEGLEEMAKALHPELGGL